MRDENKTRNITHEMADALQLLGNDYTTTEVDCEPGDSAIRITKRNSEKTLYVIAYSNPDDTETRLYDEHDDLTAQCSLYNGAFNTIPPEEIANAIRKTA